MSVQETPKKNKCACKCLFSSNSTSQETDCTKCHRQNTGDEKEEMPLLSPVTTPKVKVTPAMVENDFFQEYSPLPLKKAQKDKKRCFCCSRKLGLLGIQCKCGYIFCGGHRIPENHQCDYDHKKFGLEKLKLQLKKTTKAKIQEF